MKLLTRTAFVFLTALALVAAAYAGNHSDTDIAYAVTGGNIYFDKSSGTVTDCDESVTEAVIPAQIDGVSVTSIGMNAFFRRKSLTGVAIPDSVTSIKSSAFFECESLTSVEIPNSVTSIKSQAFYRCESLTSVDIPHSVVSIGYSAFEGCASLTNVNVEIGNENYVSLDGILFDKSQTSLICYPARKTGLSYQIPASVTSIEDGAFSKCTNLTSVKIPNNVTEIGWSAFKECTNLTSMAIPNSVIDIGVDAFYGCINLTSMAIPDSVTAIGVSAFKKCTSLRDIYYTGTKAQWEKIQVSDRKTYPDGSGRGVGGSSDIGLSSNLTTIHYNASMPDTLTAPELRILSALTVNGHTINKADLKNLTEISIPVLVSGDTPISVKVCVPFFDDSGRFLGMGFVTTSVDKNTASVTVPVTDDVSEAGKVAVMFMNADCCPMSSATRFDIAA